MSNYLFFCFVTQISYTFNAFLLLCCLLYYAFVLLSFYWILCFYFTSEVFCNCSERCYIKVNYYYYYYYYWH